MTWKRRAPKLDAPASICESWGIKDMRWIRGLLLGLLLGVTSVWAQDSRPQPGDPPIVGRITVEAPNADGIVRIVGSQGSVFGGATVAVRNLFTGETVYATAGGLGSWAVSLYGPGATPFWISPNAGAVGADRQRFPGSLPGGPGAILYGTRSIPPETNVTQIALDGALDDWDAYPDVAAGRARALANSESLYLAFSAAGFPRAYDRVELIFTIDTVTYGLRFDPRRAETPILRRLNPNAAEIGAVARAYTLAPGGALEARLLLNFVERALRITFDSVRWLDANGGEIDSAPINLLVPRFAERDGIVRPPNAERAQALTFDAGGRFGARWWTAAGRAIQDGRTGMDALRLNGGDSLRLELDVRLDAPLPLDASLRGRIRLVPFVLDGRPIAGEGTNFGWTSAVSASGLPIDNVIPPDGGVSAAVDIPAHQIVRRRDNVAFFPMDFALTLPDDLPAGLYVPVFEGEIVGADGTARSWTALDGAPNADAPPTRLPLVINVGAVGAVTLPWALFMDAPSDGARGLLPENADGALSNRVRFNPPLYVLPPRIPGGDLIPYSLEPALPLLLPNRYDSTSPPLFPVRLPGGQMTVRVTRPDDTTESFGVLSIAQNAVSTADADVSARFGTTAPVDFYSLTPLEPTLRAYRFDQYGEYRIELRGEIQDIFGNRYMGGGTYRVLIAETMDMLPAVLPGTPFETGDTFHTGAHVYPSVPADVRVTLRIYPLDGAPVIERVFEGTANRFGVFEGGEARYMFDTPGEYTVDYEARYTDRDGRLWAASLRGAGVIANRGERDLILHGTRRIDTANGSLRQAWYEAATLGLTGGLTLYFPYHSGDILWKTDEIGRVRPSMHVQDIAGDYRAWLLNALAPESVVDGLTLARRAVERSLPIGVIDGSDSDSSSYTYISAVRPGVTARQLLDGGLNAGDPGWTPDDPYNRQIGAGIGGDRPGDYTFLFGGAVIRAGEIAKTAIYAAMMVTIAPDDPRGTRVYPPGRGAAGAGDGGALLTVRGTPVEMFFHATGVRPGDVLRVGDAFTFAGQVAPPLASHVRAAVRSPSGVVRQLGGTANRIGYYYNPTEDFRLDEPGLWTVEVRVEHQGWTSAGQVEPPYPSGGVLGGDGARFYFYVLANERDLLEWNPRLTDALIAPAVSYNFSFTLPAGWRSYSAHYTIATPAQIIETGELRLNGRSFTYQYNPATLAERFPFLENVTRTPAQLGAERAHLTDQRFLTFYGSGIDETGTPRVLARRFLLWYDRLISLD
jgi:hypothetical protein